MKREFIEENRAVFPVQRMCDLLTVAPSSYYAWRKRTPSKREQNDAIFSTKIKQVFEASDKTYGYLRIWKEFLAEGIACGKHRIARLMRQNGWCVRGRKRFKTTTRSNPAHEKAPNLLDQDFSAKKMNEKWTTDITYIRTGEGWLYLAVVLDLFSRRVVGWAMDKRMETSLVIDALKMAIEQRGPSADLIHHSDRGSQYTAKAYREALASNNLIASMSRRGNCYDNAVTESFFGTLKTERVHHRHYTTRAAAKRDIFSYIEGYYNRWRRHSTLDYLCPHEFEQLHAQGA